MKQKEIDVSLNNSKLILNFVLEGAIINLVIVMVKRAVVLSGGGGKGAYQIGVWRAIRRMHYKYNIVTGTSVGALNGAYMVQKDYFKALSVWKNMDFEKVYDKHTLENFTKEGKQNVASMYAKGILIDHGMNIDNLEELIDFSLNEKKFRKMRIDYGLVTFNLSKLKPEFLTKEEIPSGKLKDYLIASATCYPVFKKKEIGKETFVDGGLYDNLPINLALELGAEEIIAVDLKAVGIKQKIKDCDAKIHIISPRNKLGSFLVFDKEESRRAMALGYNDTMKTFSYYDGDKYTFKKDHLLKNYKRYEKDFLLNIKHIFSSTKDKKLLDKIFAISSFNKLFKMNTEKENRKLVNKTIEYLGLKFSLPEESIYDIRVYNKILLNKLKEETKTEAEIDNIIKLGIKGKVLSSKEVIKYLYTKMEKADNNKRVKKELCALATLFSKDFLAALYLYTITD